MCSSFSIWRLCRRRRARRHPVGFLCPRQERSESVARSGSTDVCARWALKTRRQAVLCHARPIVGAMANAPVIAALVLLCITVPRHVLACTNNLLLAVAVFDGPQDAMIFTMEWTTVIMRRCDGRGSTDKRYHGEEQRCQNLPSADHQFPHCRRVMQSSRNRPPAGCVVSGTSRIEVLWIRSSSSQSRQVHNLTPLECRAPFWY